MVLYDFFSQNCDQFLLSNPLQPNGNVFLFILQKEARREILDTNSTFSPSNNLVFYVNSFKKFQSNNNKYKSIKKSKPKRSYCDVFGHTKDKCYKIVDYLPNYFKIFTIMYIMLILNLIVLQLLYLF